MSSSEADSSDVAVPVKRPIAVSGLSTKRRKKNKHDEDIASPSMDKKSHKKHSKLKHKSSGSRRDQGETVMSTSMKKKSLKRKTQFSDHSPNKKSSIQKLRVEIDSESESSESDTEDDESSEDVTSFTNRKQKDKRKEKDEKSEFEGFSQQTNIAAHGDDEYSTIREELSHMSFEELQKLRDRLGIKVYNQVMKGGSKNDGFSTGKKFSRENKNRPMEISSKKRVSAFREIVHVKKKVSRDPRFDDMSGTFNETIFKSSYAFLDEVKKKEREKLNKQLRKAKTTEDKQNIQFLINKMGQQESADKQKKLRKDLEKKWKKKELSRVEGGKNPYFLKKGDLLKLELAEKYKELKKSGRLEKYLGKKRKKNASKEKKKLPV